MVHKEKVSTGMKGLIGETGIAINDFGESGKIMVHGELWNARSDEAVKKDDKLEVTKTDGMILHVKKINAGTKPEES